MRRRQLLSLAGVAAAIGGPTAAQQVPRVGFLTVGDPEPTWTLFRNAMAELGYVEGSTVSYSKYVGEARSAAASAATLVDSKVDVIVAMLTPAIVAAANATKTVPIVFNGGAPESGLVRNVARPEGNLTGVWGATSIVAGKSVQLFRDLKPTTRSVGLLLNSPDPFNVPLRHEIEAAAKTLTIEIVPVMLQKGDEIAGACEDLARRGVDGVMVQPSLPLGRAAAEAVRFRLPAVSYRREFARLGGLLAYGADQAALIRLSAGQVDRVLKGAKPSDLPVQQATKFELIVNQKTARALDLSIPPLFLARADELIE